jgi:hypothetical protein
MMFAAGAQAQATRTWVSGVGDDANPCSRTAPCKTFAGAISKTAANGEIDVLDPGGFGGVTITKSITIDGGPFAGGALVTLGSNGFLVNSSTAKVTLRNLTVQGAGSGGSGVRVVSASEVHLNNVVITGMARGVDYVNNVTGTLTVENSRIYSNTNAGISVIPAAAVATRVLVDNTQIYKNVGDGMILFGGTNSHIRNTTIWGHGANQGINVLENAGQTTEVMIENCLIGNNTNGLFLSGTGGAIVSVGRTTISGNTSNGMNIAFGHQVISFGDNHLSNPGNNTFSSTPGDS